LQIGRQPKRILSFCNGCRTAFYSKMSRSYAAPIARKYPKWYYLMHQEGRSLFAWLFDIALGLESISAPARYAACGMDPVPHDQARWGQYAEASLAS
jgi:hypothetical protein